MGLFCILNGMNFLTAIVRFITNSKIKLSHKAALTVCVLLTIVIVDNVFGISFHFRTKWKLENLRTANDIITNPASDSNTVKYAIQLREKIINRRTIIDYFFSRKASLNSKKASTNNAPATPNKIESPIRIDFWYYLSSLGLFVIGAVLIFFSIILDRSIKSSFIQKLGSAILTSGIIIFLGYISHWLTSRIDWSYDKPHLMYFVNALTQVAFMGICLFVMLKTPTWEDVKPPKKYPKAS